MLHIKIANARYNSLKSEFEITLNRHNAIVACDDDGSIPSLKVNNVPIKNLMDHPKDSLVGMQMYIKLTFRD